MHLRPSTLNAKPRFLGRLLIVLLVLIAALLIYRLERRPIQDWIALLHYSPPASVVSLATEDTMTPYATHVFYVNHPSIDDKTSFAGVCSNGTEQTVVLGCYHSDQAGIYLLKVTDSQLSGVEQVTAAHETLHAIYDRLSASKKQQVDNWLVSYYDTGLTDPNIKAQIASYRKTEPNDVVNEMHSLFGTEVANLPPELETYYAQYFTDRSAVVDNYLHYQGALGSRQSQITADDSQLNSWQSQITQDKSSISAELSSLQSAQALLDQEKSSGNLDAYNQGVPGYNQQVASYNSLLSAYQSLVTKYNQLVSTRNSLALEEQQLVQELSSQGPAPQSSK